jgi:hypothetical protein
MAYSAYQVPYAYDGKRAKATVGRVIMTQILTVKGDSLNKGKVAFAAILVCLQVAR